MSAGPAVKLKLKTTLAQHAERLKDDVTLKLREAGQDSVAVAEHLQSQKVGRGTTEALA